MLASYNVIMNIVNNKLSDELSQVLFYVNLNITPDDLFFSLFKNQKERKRNKSGPPNEWQQQKQQQQQTNDVVDDNQGKKTKKYLKRKNLAKYFHDMIQGYSRIVHRSPARDCV